MSKQRKPVNVNTFENYLWASLPDDCKIKTTYFNRNLYITVKKDNKTTELEISARDINQNSKTLDLLAKEYARRILQALRDNKNGK